MKHNGARFLADVIAERDDVPSVRVDDFERKVVGLDGTDQTERLRMTREGYATGEQEFSEALFDGNGVPAPASTASLLLAQTVERFNGLEGKAVHGYPAPKDKPGLGKVAGNLRFTVRRLPPQYVELPSKAGERLVDGEISHYVGYLLLPVLHIPHRRNVKRQELNVPLIGFSQLISPLHVFGSTPRVISFQNNVSIET